MGSSDLGDSGSGMSDSEGGALLDGDVGCEGV